jgi:hypothetical protein
MDRQKVDSSNIDSIGFEPGPPAVLEVQFKGGGVYQYRSAEANVVQEHYTELMKAESKGRHFTAHVRHDKRLQVTRVDHAAPGQGGQ